MRAPTVLIAPDKFKGSLTAAQVADALADGILVARPETQVRRLPLADGGDGSVEAALAAGFRASRVEVAGPLGDPATSMIAWDGATAVVEAATTSGLQMVPPDRRDALAASSLGFGQAVRAAVEQGARRVVLALGGSASTDGGAGLLAGLGWRFLDDDGRELAPTGGNLARIGSVDLSAAVELSGVELIAASDVLNPLLGPTGAAAVYAPQKGASPEQVEELEEGLTHLVQVLQRTHPAGELAERPSAGAAGGLGFASLLLGARVVSGAEFFLDLLDFDTACKDCDLVITGEGRIDEQTLQGKLPAVVARRAAPVRVEAVVGRSDLPGGDAPEAGITRIRSVSERTDHDTAGDPALTSRLLREIGQEIAQELPVR